MLTQDKIMHTLLLKIILSSTFGSLFFWIFLYFMKPYLQQKKKNYVFEFSTRLKQMSKKFCD